MHIHTTEQPVCTLGFGDFTCNWGTHFCGLYESESERDDLLYAFLHQGDVDGNHQIYSHIEDTDDRFRVGYTARYPDEVANLDDPRRFTCAAAESLYYPSGRFQPHVVTGNWIQVLERYKAEGRNLRVIADTEWALCEVPGRELLIPYEARLNGLIPRYPVTATCFYDLRRFSGKTIMGVLRTHRFTISCGTIVENPYYDPEGWIAQNAPDFAPFV
jgi:hypothetical protein